MPKELKVLTLLGLLAVWSAPALAQQQYVVGERYTGNVYKLTDTNDDGDALDAGEKTLYATGLGELTDLRRLGSSVLAVNRSAGTVNILRDLNGDGDCLDAGENVLWASGFTSGFGLTVGKGGAVYAADYGRDSVYRLKDVNGDGDVLDAGENVLYAQGLGGVVSVLATHHGLYATGYNLGNVSKLLDINGDGDALDAGEVVAYSPSTIPAANGLLAGRGGKIFASSPTSNTVYRMIDTNGDGTATDPAETLSYADAVYGGLSGPWNMAPHASGGFLLAQFGGNKVSLVRDLTGDGDALDQGEIVTFADGIASPTGLEALRGPGAYMVNIISGTGTLDVGKPDFYAIVDGSTVGRGAISACLETGRNVLISTDNPYGFEAGTIYQDANNPITKTKGPDASITMRADSNVVLCGGIASTSGKLNVSLVANDPTLAYRGTDGNFGYVALAGPITTNGGSFTAAGANVFIFTSGPVHTNGGNVSMTVSGGVVVDGDLLAGTGNLSITAPYGIWLTTGRMSGTGTIESEVVSQRGTIEVPSGVLTLNGQFYNEGSLTVAGGGTLRQCGPQVIATGGVEHVTAGAQLYLQPTNVWLFGTGTELLIDSTAAVHVSGPVDPFTDRSDGNLHMGIQNDGLFHVLSGSHVTAAHILSIDPNIRRGTTLIDANATLIVTRIVQDALVVNGTLVLGDDTETTSALAIPSILAPAGTTGPGITSVLWRFHHFQDSALDGLAAAESNSFSTSSDATAYLSSQATETTPVPTPLALLGLGAAALLKCRNQKMNAA